ncbi:ubiquinol-cytochrome-c reductase complex assembly factor 1-like isoform X2 [Acanthaster planci]|uniref:Ubiquinol-cytochrome-c reductase complex assembly factor 1-like isoform X2 n=2 Tax=Acanthaster planci TaxID=133434 RepID=A0A8B7Y6V3_ACAPL|nr:ubiquinol-cytochrome-c reductase complex assembly factor 1-like isoform X2 [Acanthaster planci]
MYTIYRTSQMATSLGSAQIASRGIQLCCRSMGCLMTQSGGKHHTTCSSNSELTYSRWAYLRRGRDSQLNQVQRHVSTGQPNLALVRRSAVLPESKPTPFKRLMEKAGIPVQMRYNRFKIRVAGLNLYTSCVDNIDCHTFFRACGMPDTLFSWFLVTELHVWMCMVRLKQEGQEGKYMVHYLIMSMWHDIQERGRVMGIPSIKMKESLSKMVEQFNAALFGYDEGLLSNDSVLAGALWRNLFVRRDIEPEQLADMVEYIRQQVQYLETLDSAQLLQVGRIKWRPFKGIVPDKSVALPKASSIEEELDIPEVDKIGAQ